MSREEALTFDLDGDTLLGILHRPDNPTGQGVVVVVGGPQYRIGAHRQFVHLARHLAKQGITVLRFDYRGMGDSEGDFAGFENISDDIDAALSALRKAAPNVTSITLWGLCDAAAAILMKDDYAEDIAGLVVLNPWVRTEAGEAKAFVRHYYLQRLMSRDFWRKVVSGKFRAADSLKDAGSKLSQARNTSTTEPLPARVVAGIKSSARPILLFLSGQDLVAREFEDCAGELVLGKDAPHVAVERLPASDHTFSREEWKAEVAHTTARWMEKIGQ